MAGSIFVPIGLKLDNRSLKRAEGSFKSFGHSIKGILGTVGAAFAADRIFDLAKESVKAAAEDIKSQKLLERQIHTSTKASKEQLSTNEKWLSSLSMTVGIMDDRLRPVLANAVRGTGSLSKAQKLLKIALDGSAATGKPLNAVMQALIKASNGQTMALYRLAPELKASKGGVDAFAKSVKGAAALAADPFDRFKVATDELKEKFGKLLLPMVTNFVDYLTQKVVPAVSDFLDQVGNPKTDAGKMFKDIKDAVKSAFKDVQDFFALFGNGNAMKGFGNVVSALVKALPSLLALKGIMMLASAGTAIKNLIIAMTAIQGKNVGNNTPGVPVLGGGKGAGRMIGPKTLGEFSRLSNTQFLGLSMMSAGGGVKILSGSEKAATDKVTMDFLKRQGKTLNAQGQIVNLTVNSYGSTPHEFENLVIKALKKYNRLNGSK